MNHKKFVYTANVHTADLVADMLYSYDCRQLQEEERTKKRFLFPLHKCS